MKPDQIQFVPLELARSVRCDCYAYRIYGELMYRCISRDHAIDYISNRQLAEICTMTVHAVSKGITALVDLGWIIRKGSGAGRSLYPLTVPQWRRIAEHTAAVNGESAPMDPQTLSTVQLAHLLDALKRELEIATPGELKHHE